MSADMYNLPQIVDANWVARPDWLASKVGFRIRRQKELNITINELNAIQNSRTSVEKKSIYLGIWPLYIGKSHTKECHIQRLTAAFRGLRRPETQRVEKLPWRLLKSCKAPSENQLKSTFMIVSISVRPLRCKPTCLGVRLRNNICP